MEANTELKQIQIDECTREQAEQFGLENRMLQCTEEHRIKVTSAEIIVIGGNTDGLRQNKPYYAIKYKKVGQEESNVGFGSYKLPYVLHWLDTYFEIIGE